MNNIDVSGQTAIITGGAQGLGLAFTKRLLQSGAKVCIWDINREQLTKTKAALGESAIAVQVDISDPDSVANAYRQTQEVCGDASIMINSAGISGPNQPLDEYPIDEWRKIIDINLNGTFYVNRAVVPAMKKNNYGRIVNVASVAGKEGNPNASAYSASKAAVIGLTKSLGKELANFDIAVNCITPAAARTPIFDQMKQEHIDYMLGKIPRGRFLEGDEAANMVAWLVSAENSFTTASVFDLSGGRATY